MSAIITDTLGEDTAYRIFLLATLLALGIDWSEFKHREQQCHSDY